MESLIPLLENLFTETNPEKRAAIEASLDAACIFRCLYPRN